MTKDKDWFVSWFNTPYYHTLYKHRDHNEAQEFIKNLIFTLKQKKLIIIPKKQLKKKKIKMYMVFG